MSPAVKGAEIQDGKEDGAELNMPSRLLYPPLAAIEADVEITWTPGRHMARFLEVQELAEPLSAFLELGGSKLLWRSAGEGGRGSRQAFSAFRYMQDRKMWPWITNDYGAMAQSMNAFFIKFGQSLMYKVLVNLVRDGGIMTKHSRLAGLLAAVPHEKVEKMELAMAKEMALSWLTSEEPFNPYLWHDFAMVLRPTFGGVPIDEATNADRVDSCRIVDEPPSRIDVVYTPDGLVWSESPYPPAMLSAILGVGLGDLWDVAFHRNSEVRPRGPYHAWASTVRPAKVMDLIIPDAYDEPRGFAAIKARFSAVANSIVYRSLRTVIHSIRLWAGHDVHADPRKFCPLVPAFSEDGVIPSALVDGDPNGDVGADLTDRLSLMSDCALMIGGGYVEECVATQMVAIYQEEAARIRERVRIFLKLQDPKKFLTKPNVDPMSGGWIELWFYPAYKACEVLAEAYPVLWWMQERQLPRVALRASTMVTVLPCLEAATKDPKKVPFPVVYGMSQDWLSLYGTKKKTEVQAAQEVEEEDGEEELKFAVQLQRYERDGE